MKYSYNWLKELSDTKKNPAEVAEMLTMKALEVEEVVEIGNDFDNVVVGEILELGKHPNADRLQLTKISVGKEQLSIVCGAHNISVGDKVPVAMIGAKLPNGLEIKETEIRGVKSFGMLCAADELGLGEDHSGIYLLSKDVEVGTPLCDVLQNKDTTFEIKVLPDRAHDAMSHVGLAREIAAIDETEFAYDYDALNLPKRKSKILSVTVKNNKICPRYIGAVMQDVVIQESPQWLKMRIEACGIRSINNVVDATNLVMLELGQPLHAFDADMLTGEDKEIIVRNAKETEKIELLSGESYVLNEGDIVIADQKNVIALAGVMGGNVSGVTEKTKTLVLEAANFNPTMIRRTRTRLNLPTDAAIRFEKDIDPNIAEKAMVRLIEILEHIADATLEGIVDVYPSKVKPWKVTLELDYIHRLLGIEVSKAETKRILKSLGIDVNMKRSELVAEIPTFRIDLHTPEDLIEEIGRIYGYDKVVAVAPKVAIQAPKLNVTRSFERILKSNMVAYNFAEMYNYSFYSEKDANLSQFGLIEHVQIENPDNPQQTLMRVSLIPNLLKNIHENLKHQKEFNIFELGRVFWPIKNNVLPEEKRMLVGAVVLEKRSAKLAQTDQRKISPFYDAKQYVDKLFTDLGIADYYFDTFEAQPSDSLATLWHEGRTARIMVEGKEKPVGYLGEINPFVLTGFDIHTRVAMFELDVESLVGIYRSSAIFSPIRKYPAVTRDISLLLKEPVSVSDILKTIREEGKAVIIDVELFDAVTLALGTSLAFHVVMGSEEKTLKNEEVEAVMNKIISQLEKKFGIELRK